MIIKFDKCEKSQQDTHAVNLIAGAVRIRAAQLVSKVVVT
jgi:hypothetical protein